MNSSAYAIAYLRDVDFGDAIVSGVPAGYQATDGLAAMLAAAT